MPTLRIVDRDARTIVHETQLAATDAIPRENDHVWVPENGDTAFRVHGVEFDFETNTVTAICNRLDKQRYYE